MEVQQNTKTAESNLRLALYPGKFKYFHEGHFDTVQKALKLFDQVLILCCDTPDQEEDLFERAQRVAGVFEEEDRVGVGYWTGLLAQYTQDTRISAIIRPLKDSTIISKEKSIVYANEDMGVSVPFVYLPVSRNHSHITSKTYQHLSYFTEQGGSNASSN
jgi:pantetheine-phosphate adenylyltransferase